MSLSHNDGNSTASWKSFLFHSLFKTEVSRTLIAATWLISVVFVMTTAQIWADIRWQQSHTDQYPLEDIIYSFTGLVDPLWWSMTSARSGDATVDANTVTMALLTLTRLADIMVMAFAAATIFGLLIIGLWPKPNAIRYMWIRRVLWITAILYGIRAVTITVTVVPSPRLDCHINDLSDQNSIIGWFLLSLKMVIGVSKACTDNIFSGHVMLLTSCALLWSLCCKSRWFVVGIWIYVVTGAYVVIISRLHYTVDVILASFITWAVYSLYFNSLLIHFLGTKLNITSEIQDLERVTVVRYSTSSSSCYGSSSCRECVTWPVRSGVVALLNGSLVPIIAWMDGVDLRTSMDEAGSPRPTAVIPRASASGTHHDNPENMEALRPQIAMTIHRSSSLTAEKD